MDLLVTNLTYKVQSTPQTAPSVSLASVLTCFTLLTSNSIVVPRAGILKNDWARVTTSRALDTARAWSPPHVFCKKRLSYLRAMETLEAQQFWQIKNPWGMTVQHCNFKQGMYFPTTSSKNWMTRYLKQTKIAKSGQRTAELLKSIDKPSLMFVNIKKCPPCTGLIWRSKYP